MKILLKRIAKKPTYTIGKIYVDGQYVCDCIEDKDRGLKQSMTLEQIKKLKVYGQTAIPTGEYKVTLNVISPKYSKSTWYKQNANGGRVPRILNVKGFDGVLIHTGNYASESLGCILVGINDKVGMVSKSKETFKKLYQILQSSKDDITLTIQ